MIMDRPVSPLRRLAVLALGLAIALMVLMPVFAFAAASAPETVAQSVSEPTKITWAWGEAAQAVASAILSVLSMVALYFFRKLPENIIAMIGNARGELIISNAQNWANNAVKDATTGKTLTVDVGNKVLAEMLSYILNNGTPWLIGWLGGPLGIAQKIWSKLPLEANADASALPSVVAQVVADQKKAA
jgi:hypothetical protein